MNEKTAPTPKPEESALVDLRITSDNHEHNGKKVAPGTVVKVDPKVAEIAEAKGYGKRV